jgi:hypothetical protein
MKADQVFANRQTALVLQVTGIILILGVLVDYIILATPPDFLNSTWLVNLIDQCVGRGTVPLLGVAFIVFGIWIDRVSNGENNSRKGLLLFTLVLSLLLGAVFVLFVPLHFNSSRLASAAQTRQINQQADAAQQQLNAQLAQQKEKVSALLADEQQVAQLQQQLDNAPPAQQAQLQQIRETLDKVKANPKALDQEVEKARTQGMAQIKQRQQEALDQAQTATRNSRTQATTSSILLAIGYFVIGGTGLSATRSAGSRPKAARSKKRRK